MISGAVSTNLASGRKEDAFAFELLVDNWGASRVEVAQRRQNLRRVLVDERGSEFVMSKVVAKGTRVKQI